MRKQRELEVELAQQEGREVQGYHSTWYTQVEKCDRLTAEVIHRGAPLLK